MLFIIDAVALFFTLIGVAFTLWKTIKDMLTENKQEIKEYLSFYKNEINDSEDKIKRLSKRIESLERYLSNRANVISHDFKRKKDDDEEL